MSLSSDRFDLTPSALAWIALYAVILGAWVLLFVATAEHATRMPIDWLGPGMSWLAPIIPSSWQTDGLPPLIGALCLSGPGAGEGAPLVVFHMWALMTLAMMLPTAGPMILTYGEIAETAQRQGQRIVAPHVLIAGYLTVWLGFAAIATVAQVSAMSLAASPGAASIAMPASAALFLAAGLYQFSALKQACLRACQQPFSFFFLNWTDRRGGVFRLGVRQGLYCLGCCIAMMLLMFAAGAMNVVWMALIGLVMLVEKMTVSAVFGRAIGAAFVAVGLTILGAWGSGLVI